MSWIVSDTQKFDIKSYTSPLNTIVIKHYKYRNCRIHEKTFVKVVYHLQLMTTQFTSAYIINISKKKFLRTLKKKYIFYKKTSPITDANQVSKRY